MKSVVLIMIAIAGLAVCTANAQLVEAEARTVIDSAVLTRTPALQTRQEAYKLVRGHYEHVQRDTVALSRDVWYTTDVHEYGAGTGYVLIMRLVRGDTVWVRSIDYGGSAPHRTTPWRRVTLAESPIVPKETTVTVPATIR